MSKETNVQMIPLNKIVLRKNSRLDIHDAEIAGLMGSIKNQGLLQNIGVVKDSKKPGFFQIAYGNRRFLAVSKLGYGEIAAKVYETKEQSDIDMQNLTENLHRRSITLLEAGRYMVELRDGKGLSSQEIGVRMSLTKGYVESCITAYQDVPEKFRKDLEVRNSKDRSRVMGKVSISTARAILTAARKYNLNTKHQDLLFMAARDSDKFTPANIGRYAAALKEGKTDFLDSVDVIFRIQTNLQISEKEKIRLEKKYVDRGPFNSLPQVVQAIVRGEVSEHIKAIK